MKGVDIMYDNIIEIMNNLTEELLKYRIGELKEVQQYATNERDIAMLSVLSIYCKNVDELCDVLEKLSHGLAAIHYYKKANID
jgi:hypothetical protein